MRYPTISLTKGNGAEFAGYFAAPAPGPGAGSLCGGAAGGPAAPKPGDEAGAGGGVSGQGSVLFSLQERAGLAAKPAAQPAVGRLFSAELPGNPVLGPLDSGGLSRLGRLGHISMPYPGAWLAVRLRLPQYYDENRISAYYDGPFRLNLAGAALNNKNWPRVIRAGQIWSAASALLLPLFYAVGLWLAPGFWSLWGALVLLLLWMVSLFVPLYRAAKL